MLQAVSLGHILEWKTYDFLTAKEISPANFHSLRNADSRMESSLQCQSHTMAVHLIFHKRRCSRELAVIQTLRLI